MAEQRGPGTLEQRIAFLESNRDLFVQCSAPHSKERRMQMRELVNKARAHFGYSEKTIAQDILRPLMKAYARHMERPTDTIGSQRSLRPTSDERRSTATSENVPVRRDA